MQVWLTGEWMHLKLPSIVCGGKDSWKVRLRPEWKIESATDVNENEGNISFFSLTSVAVSVGRRMCLACSWNDPHNMLIHCQMETKLPITCQSSDCDCVQVGWSRHTVWQTWPERSRRDGWFTS